MAKQRTPRSQSQQNIEAEQRDLQPEADEYPIKGEEQSFTGRAGAETGGNRAPRIIHTRYEKHKTEPAAAAYEGSVSTRTPKNAAQGITSHSAAEESARQEKVVRDRLDAQAGVNHS